MRARNDWITGYLNKDQDYFSNARRDLLELMPPIYRAGFSRSGRGPALRSLP